MNSPKAPPAGRGAKYPEGKKLLRVRGNNNIGESSNDIPASGAGGDGELKVGAAVVHDRFGRGLVTAIEGNPPNTTATVDFREHGSKKLLLRFAKLRIE